jgi:hypothetical protein
LTTGVVTSNKVLDSIMGSDSRPVYTCPTPTYLLARVRTVVDLLERVPTLVRADHAALVIANDHERGFCRGGSLIEFVALMESGKWTNWWKIART